MVRQILLNKTMELFRRVDVTLDQWLFVLISGSESEFAQRSDLIGKGVHDWINVACLLITPRIVISKLDPKGAQNGTELG